MAAMPWERRSQISADSFSSPPLHRPQDVLDLVGQFAQVGNSQHVAVTLEGVGLPQDGLQGSLVVGLFF